MSPYLQQAPALVGLCALWCLVGCFVRVSGIDEPRPSLARELAERSSELSSLRYGVECRGLWGEVDCGGGAEAALREAGLSRVWPIYESAFRRAAVESWAAFLAREPEPGILYVDLRWEPSDGIGWTALVHFLTLFIIPLDWGGELTARVLAVDSCGREVDLEETDEVHVTTSSLLPTAWIGEGDLRTNEPFVASSWREPVLDEAEGPVVQRAVLRLLREFEAMPECREEENR